MERAVKLFFAAYFENVLELVEGAALRLQRVLYENNSSRVVRKKIVDWYDIQPATEI